MRVFLWLVAGYGLFVAGLGLKSGRVRNLSVEGWVEEEMDKNFLANVKDTNEESGGDRDIWTGPSSEPSAEGDESNSAESPQNTDGTRSATGNDNNPLGAARAQDQQPLWLDDYNDYINNYSYDINLTLGEKIKRFIGLDNLLSKNVVPPLPTYSNHQQNQNVTPVVGRVHSDSQRQEQRRDVSPRDTSPPESYEEHEFLQAARERSNLAEHKGFRNTYIPPLDATIPREPELLGEPTPPVNIPKSLKYPEFFEAPEMREDKLPQNSKIIEDKAPFDPKVLRKRRTWDSKLPEEPKFPRKLKIRVPKDSEASDKKAPVKLHTVESLVQLKNATGADGMVINNITILENITVPRNVTLIRNIKMLRNKTSLNVTGEKEAQERKPREEKIKQPPPSRYKFMPLPTPQRPEAANRRVPPRYELPVPVSTKPKAPPRQTPPLSEIPIPISSPRPEAQPSSMRQGRLRRPQQEVFQPARKNTTVLTRVSHLVNITVPDNQTMTHRSGPSGVTAVMDGVPGAGGAGGGGDIVLPHNITVIVNNEQEQ